LAPPWESFLWPLVCSTLSQPQLKVAFQPRTEKMLGREEKAKQTELEQNMRASPNSV